MTSRVGTAVVVQVIAASHDGEKNSALYGPFLPHAGSAVSLFVQRIDDQYAASGRYKDWATSVEPVFIGDDESDCAVVATR